jgi:hypothetical protein
MKLLRNVPAVALEEGDAVGKEAPTEEAPHKEKQVAPWRRDWSRSRARPDVGVDGFYDVVSGFEGLFGPGWLSAVYVNISDHFIHIQPCYRMFVGNSGENYKCRWLNWSWLIFEG